MKHDLISFKGVSEGIFVDVYGDDIIKIKDQIDEKLKRDYNFYKDTKLIGIKGEGLSRDQLIELKMMLRYKYDLDIVDEELPESIMQENILEEVEVDEELDLTNCVDCGMAKFVKGTLRSGQVINYPGNIIVIGDVNPGALLEAEGNIVVLGTLKGVAHAGMNGDLESIVAAYDLQPTQLRIGDVIGRPPDGGMTKSRVPEVASVREKEVIIETYLPNK